MSAPEVSHGRGGAGNINPDNTKYVDGEVVRVGVVGSHGDGAFSTGRGGAANIGDAGTKQTVRADTDLVPEAAVRPSRDNTDYHTGRGGAGNERLASKTSSDEPAAVAKPAPTAPIGLADLLKKKLLGVFKK
ncbi:hypothetical protein VTJ49DRAFT_1426 [Mycothermus thermophilus]|uniref:Uncharacterized protein n=1 Tax=Humicola insolens TaxID=85995 RepID=A0ABR3VCU8_HUMIN